MNILMMTNTYLPHVGGVARSIERFTERYRYLGHHVKIVAPEFDDMNDVGSDVVRIPAIRHFNHTDFSVVLPIPHILKSAVDDFEPDIIHSHHPFLVGGTALRVAHTHGLPLVFTHHTKYEDYTHNVPGDSPALKQFVQKLATNYANTCDRVFVPSDSMNIALLDRGVTAPMSVVPTGVVMKQFENGSGGAMRARLGIPEGAFVIGHLGRITREKNLPFLSKSVIAFLQAAKPELNACFVVFGGGPLVDEIVDMFSAADLSDRLYLGGVVSGQKLVDAYHSMDLFVFASKTETQGMVITEAMASGVPVIAIDASGVREVVRDGQNGRLLSTEKEDDFAAAISWFSTRSTNDRQTVVNNALETAHDFSMEQTANTALELYSRLRNYNAAHRGPDYPLWVDAMHVFESEWVLLKNTVSAAVDTLTE